jgi:glutaredoxin
MTKVTVWLFTAEECQYTAKARLFLDQSGVDYEERNVTRDLDALRDMVFLTGRIEVPVLYGGYDAVVGFDEAHWNRVLDRVRVLQVTGDPFALPELYGPDPLHL